MFAALKAKMEVAQGKKKKKDDKKEEKKKQTDAAAGAGPALAVADAEAASTHQGLSGAESDAGGKRRGFLHLPANKADHLCHACVKDRQNAQFYCILGRD